METLQHIDQQPRWRLYVGKDSNPDRGRKGKQRDKGASDMGTRMI